MKKILTAIRHRHLISAEDTLPSLSNYYRSQVVQNNAEEHATVEDLVELVSSSTNMAVNIDSFEQLITRIERLRMRRCSSTVALTIFVVYAPTLSYEEEVEAFYMDLEKLYREDHAFYKVIIGDFNAKVGPRRTPEEFHIGTRGLP
ncbi:hypothetical protein RB195_021079 [Necator americanus]|uniref:Endonuclease/exonuclease/phosphatase domain-containing protein n=1 Tax=Necator americanus TaxID=51031 RepID=A0ABR1EB76_NECAM